MAIVVDSRVFISWITDWPASAGGWTRIGVSYSPLAEGSPASESTTRKLCLDVYGWTVGSGQCLGLRKQETGSCEDDTTFGWGVDRG